MELSLSNAYMTGTGGHEVQKSSSGPSCFTQMIWIPWEWLKFLSYLVLLPLLSPTKLGKEEVLLEAQDEVDREVPGKQHSHTVYSKWSFCNSQKGTEVTQWWPCHL